MTRFRFWTNSRIGLAILSTFLSLIMPAVCKTNEIKTKKVLISQVVEHPALNKTVQGIVDELKEAGYIQNENLTLRVESAQANAALSSQIANKFLFQKADVIIGVGTISAQSFAKYASEGKINLIFSSVTDPIGSGLINSLEKPENYISGVSNFVPLEPQLELIRELQPDLKRLGVLYNPGEANSVSIVKKLEELSKRFNMTIVKQTINKTTDVAQGAIKLAGQVDAIFVSNDNTALSALQMIVKACESHEIPLYVSDTDAVEMGALAAIGPNQYAVGRQTGKMITRVLHGTDLNTIPVEFPEETELFINFEAAKKAHISFSEKIVQKATKCIAIPAKP